MKTKLLDPISIELDNIDEHGRTLELGSYSGNHSLELSNSNYIDCIININETDDGFDYHIQDIRIFEPSNLEVIQFDEDELRELIIERIVIV